MGGSHCAIPGCSTSAADSKRRGLPKYTLFSVLRPEFAKTPEIKKHRVALREFIISLRNDDDDTIQSMLHKESAMICEKHFMATDIISKTNMKHLRVGALPSLNLPKEVGPVPPVRRTLDDKEYEQIKSSEGYKRMGLCCRIPGCNQEVYRHAKQTRVWVKYTNFKVKDPTFMKADHPQSEWYQKIKDLLLQFSTKDTILDQYHRDCVFVCERHFTSTDLIYSEGIRGQTRKKLREGAMPSLNIPQMPDMALPDINRKTRSMRIKLHRGPPKPVTVSHRTFASLVASARKFSHEEWRLTIEKDMLRCCKRGSADLDQDEISLEINNEFEIGVAYFGWRVPEGHFATQFDMRKNTFNALAEFVETMVPCDGIDVPPQLEIQGDDEVAKHYVTLSSRGFSHKPITLTVLTHRSKECDMLLKKPSFGSCIACTSAKSDLKKQIEKEEKLVTVPLTQPPEITEKDSFVTMRLKNTLKKKMQECNDLAQHVARKPEFLSRLEFKKRQEEETARKFIAKKALTFEQYMKPILRYKETNELPEFFETFWRFQMEMIWKHADQKPVMHAMRYPEELMKFFGEIHLHGKEGYSHLLRSRVIAMPGRATINKYSMRMKKARENELNAIIRQVADGVSEQPEGHDLPFRIFYESDPADFQTVEPAMFQNESLSEQQKVLLNKLSVRVGEQLERATMATAGRGAQINQEQDGALDLTKQNSPNGSETFQTLEDLKAWRDALEERTQQIKEDMYRNEMKRKYFIMDDHGQNETQSSPKQCRIMEVLGFVGAQGIQDSAKEDPGVVTIEVEVQHQSESEGESGTDEDVAEENMDSPKVQKNPVRIDDLEWVLQSENAEERPE